MQPGSDISSQGSEIPSEVEKFVDFIVRDSRESRQEEDARLVPPNDEQEAEHELLREQLVEQMQRRVESAIEGETEVVYAAYPTNERGLPIDNLDEIAVHGETRSEDEIWDSYIGEVIENPTWLQLAVEANRMIVASNDYHHVAFEAIQVVRETEDGVKVLSLALGS